jgi:hypothetical protein
MPTLEVQLAKAQKDLAALEELRTTWQINGWDYYPRKRVDQMHGNDAERRGLTERIRYLQLRLLIRNERAAPPEVDPALVRLEYQSLALPTHTSEPTAPA